MSNTEKDFLTNYNIHDYELPLTTVDMAIFTIRDEALNVLLVKRNQHPAKGKWALPGGFIDTHKDKSLDDTAKRKLVEKTGVKISHVEQVASFSGKKRDPRGWSVTIAYMALIADEHIKLIKDESSEEIQWMPVHQIGKKMSLAFDHKGILNACHERLKSKIQYTSLPVNLLPSEFTLSELQTTFEILLEKPVEKKSFRRRILSSDILEETGAMKSGPSRPAKLYQVVNKEGKNYLFPRTLEGSR
jgi:ADP-ribose pyrophosphatase YjhB (NUDIX family)